MKGQAAMMDALIFMVVSASASSLLLYVSSLYGSSTNTQVLAFYNYEFAGNAIVALQYAEDSGHQKVWRVIKNEKLVAGSPQSEIMKYFTGTGKARLVWEKLTEASPSAYPQLCFQREDKSIAEFCYPVYADREFTQTYASFVRMIDKNDKVWAVSLKMNY